MNIATYVYLECFFNGNLDEFLQSDLFNLLKHQRISKALETYELNGRKELEMAKNFKYLCRDLKKWEPIYPYQILNKKKKE